MDRFNEKQLPPIKSFYSSLEDKNISLSTYAHLQKIWREFECQTLGDFHDIYLHVDVLLLASVSENFRAVSYKNFKLDPFHHYSAPGLSWAAALKTTFAKVDLLTDVDMLMMVEQGIRGGLTVVSKRYCEANNPNVPNYDPTKEQNHIVYFDVNNLYGHAMSQPLPYCDFQWIEVSKIKDIYHLLNMCGEYTGMIIEVDLHYPNDLHQQHNDYPLAPHKKKINLEMLSSYQKGILTRMKENALINHHPTEKLISSFLIREKYVLHNKTLAYYLEKGLIVTKIHRAFKFRQSAWLRPYVEFCTSKRQDAKSSFDRDFWKLMVNSIYGKTNGDKRKHKQIDMVFQDNIAVKRLRSELCQRFIIVKEAKMIFELIEQSVMMNKPLAVGFAILELAKLKMFELHYDTFKKY